LNPCSLFSVYFGNDLGKTGLTNEDYGNADFTSGIDQLGKKWGHCLFKAHVSALPGDDPIIMAEIVLHIYYQ
jgi:hypothetical protein